MDATFVFFRLFFLPFFFPRSDFRSTAVLDPSWCVRVLVVFCMHQYFRSSLAAFLPITASKINNDWLHVLKLNQAAAFES